MQTYRVFLFTAAISGFLAVGLGAFGAHGLKNQLSDHMISTWQTAVQYHFYHALALLFITTLGQKNHYGYLLKISGWGFTIGMTLFSGSLYWLALGGPNWLGPITPIGGLCLLGAWLCLALSVFKAKP